MSIIRSKNLVFCKITDKEHVFDTVIFSTQISSIAKKILPHENTIAEKSRRYEESFYHSKMQVNPVLLVYKDHSEINKIFKKIEEKQPDSKVKKDKQYAFWTTISSPILEKMEYIYDNMPYYIVADGHHRIAAAKASKLHLNLMVALISDKNIKLKWVVRELKKCPLSLGYIIESLKSEFIVTKCKDIELPNDENIFYISCKGFHYQLKLRFYDPTRRIQMINNAHNAIFKRILKKKNRELSRCVNYVPIKNQINLNQHLYSNKDKISIIFPELGISEVIHAAQNRVMLPPHSTYFEPKFANHLVTNQMTATSQIKEKSQ